MRRLRILTIVIFLIAAGLYGYSEHQKKQEVDEEVPHIEMETDSITVSVEDDEKALLEGITATDNKDGDITDSLVIESLSNFIEYGKRKMTVVAFDSDNHATKATREVIYSDYRYPRFNLQQALYFPVGSQNVMQTIGATDLLDGDITDKIKVSGDVYIDTETPGDYRAKFTVANSGGDMARLPVTITIYDPTEWSRAPQIELTDYLVYTTRGKKVHPWSFIKSVTMNGMVFERSLDREDKNLYQVDTMPGVEPAVITPDQLQIETDIDYSTRGVYEITLKLSSHAAGDMMGTREYIGSTRLIVGVR